nr:ribonuclease H-like domain-containing protein [Tanacetum cinerariifolium]
SKPKNKPSSSPNDDEEGPSSRDGSVHQPEFDDNLDQHESDEHRPHSGSDLGNVGISEQVLVFQNVFGNQTEEVCPGSRRKPIGSKWVFRIKYKSDDEINRFKALRLDSWLKMDVNNAFLYGDLNEEVYMLPPPGFFSPFDKKVCRLKKSIYGLKQAPKQWNHKLFEAPKENGLKQFKIDHSLLFKNNEKFSLFLLVFMESKRQATLSKSSAEAEYRSMATATCGVMWIVKIMT